MPHRKISGSPALIPLRGPGQQPRSQPQTVAFLPTSTAAHPPPPRHPSPISIQPLGSHKGSSHPTTVWSAEILAKVHSLGKPTWGVVAAGMCVAGTQCPNPDSRLCWGCEESRRPGESGVPSPQLCQRMECAALGVETDPAKEGEWGLLGAGGVGGSSCHKAASVPLEAEHTSLGPGVGRPLLLAQWLRSSRSQWGQGRTGGRVTVTTAMFSQSFSCEASIGTCGTIHIPAPQLTTTFPRK